MDGRKWVKVGKGALIAAGGAVISYLSAQVLPALNSSTPPGAVLVAVAPVLINVARKYLERAGKEFERTEEK